MRYEKLDDLPGHIKTILPGDYHQYYMDIFNNAYSDYQNDIIAHKIAITAVEFSYLREKEDKKT
jgi:cation transport regulator ChaB